MKKIITYGRSRNPNPKVKERRAALAYLICLGVITLGGLLTFIVLIF